MRSTSRAGSNSGHSMRARLRGRPLAAVVPIGIGHNQGPPMATRWGLHCWKRAQAEAWKPPPPEVVKLRTRRAAELGMGYRQLASIVMESGQVPAAMVVALDAAGGLPAGAADLLARLARPKLFLLAGSAAVAGQALEALRAAGAGVLDARGAAGEAGRAAAVLEMLAAQGASPRGTVLIGWSEADRAVATRARLAGFLPAATYFGRPAMPRAAATPQPLTGPQR